MKYLVIYDNNGNIFSFDSGDYSKPVGLQHMELVVPEGKILIGIDVTDKQHKPIFEDMPKSEVELLKEQLQATQAAVDFLLTGGM